MEGIVHYSINFQSFLSNPINLIAFKVDEFNVSFAFGFHPFELQIALIGLHWIGFLFASLSTQNSAIK